MLDATRLSRRSFGAALAATGVAVLVGCGGEGEGAENPALEASKAEDLILVLLATARRDAADLAAGAEEAGGGAATSLARAARMREVHVQRLTAEAERIGLDTSEQGAPASGDGGEGDASDDAADEGSGDAATAANRPDAEPTAVGREAARERLRAAATEAGDVAVRSRDYRAELTASIAAACTACAEVLLS